MARVVLFGFTHLLFLLEAISGLERACHMFVRAHLEEVDFVNTVNMNLLFVFC